MKFSSPIEKTLIVISVVFALLLTYNKISGYLNVKTTQISDSYALNFTKTTPAPKSASAMPADTITMSPADKPPGYKININTANKQELMQISGIGEVLAQRIIDFRLENGNFKNIESIMLVNGIGEGTFFKIQDFLTVQ